MKHLLLIPALSLLASCAGHSPKSSAESAAKDSLTVGMAAPDFTLPSQEGISLGPKDFSGRGVLGCRFGR